MPEFFQKEFAVHLMTAAAIVAVFILGARPVRRLLAMIGAKVIARTETVLDDRILAVLLAHVRPLLIVLGLRLATHEVRKGMLPTDLTLEQVLEYGDQLLYVAGVLIVLKIVVGILREFIDWYLEKASAGGGAALRSTLGPLTTKTMNVLVGMVGVIVILDHFGINIGSLVVSLGVGSLAVALAAQDTLANMIAGFVILVDRPFRVGDRIELAAGVLGDVQQIGLRSTRILNFDNNVVVLPNAELVKGRITNYTHPHAPTRVLLRFEVGLGADPAVVRRILLEIAGGQPDLLKEPPPAVFMTALTELAAQFTLVARATDYSRQFAAETTIREAAYLAFRREGIPVPVAQRLVRMERGE
jgi:MscS family membrane protein